MRLENKISKYQCNWLKNYLKVLLVKKDLKSYNRAKCIMYYFPEILKGVSEEDFTTAIKFADDTFICIGREDVRYKILDDLYMKKNGMEFKPLEWGEQRYITINDLCEHYSL